MRNESPLHKVWQPWSFNLWRIIKPQSSKSLFRYESDYFVFFFPKPERKNSDSEILQMKHVGDNFEMFVTIFDILVTNIFGIGFKKAEIFLNFKL